MTPELPRGSRPVLIIGSNSRADLGTVRALGAAGVPVHLLFSNPRSIVARSRHVRYRTPFPPPEAGDAARLEALRSVASSLPVRPVILATGDRALRFLSRTRAAWEDLIDHDLAPAPIVDACDDKAWFASSATRLGLPVPFTWLPPSAAALRERAADLQFPVFVKPLDRADWSQLPHGIVPHSKGMPVDDHRTLVALWERLEQHGGARAVVQSMVVGPDDEHATALIYRTRAGRILGVFTGAKVRILPVHAGLGVYVESRPIPEIRRIATRVVMRLGYTGFADIDFKRDVRTGEWKLLEMNCRYSTWITLAARAGCNFPAAAYASIVGTQIPALEQRPGEAWLDWRRDRAAIAAYRAEGTWAGWPSYARTLWGARSYAFWDARDPVPFILQAILDEAT